MDLKINKTNPKFIVLHLLAILCALAYQGCGRDSAGTPLGTTSSSSAAAVATQILLTQTPSTTPVQDSPFPQQPIITLADSTGTTVSSSATATIAAYSDSACTTGAVGTLSGNSVSAVAGVATFTALTHSAVETIYLKYSLGGITSCVATAISPTTKFTNTCTTGAVATTGYMYSTATTYTGNLGGIAGADAKCLTETTTNRSSLNCTRVKALISLTNAGSAISDLPANCNGTFTNATSFIAPDNSNLTVGTWSQILAGTAGNAISTVNTWLYTGANNVNGGVAPGAWGNCNEFTDSTVAFGGYVGETTGAATMIFAAQGVLDCNNLAPLLCICF